MPGLRPQSDWIVCSAPEMTTVSKPKRNPASADVMDQKKMRGFMASNRCVRERTGSVVRSATRQRGFGERECPEDAGAPAERRAHDVDLRFVR